MKHRRRWTDKLPVRGERMGALLLLVVIVTLTTGCAGLSYVPPTDASGCRAFSYPARDRITDSNGKITGYIERWERRTVCP
jgi:hypothetical protein